MIKNITNALSYKHSVRNIFRIMYTQISPLQSYTLSQFEEICLNMVLCVVCNVKFLIKLNLIIYIFFYWLLVTIICHCVLAMNEYVLFTNNIAHTLHVKLLLFQQKNDDKHC